MILMLAFDHVIISIWAAQMTNPRKNISLNIPELNEEIILIDVTQPDENESHLLSLPLELLLHLKSFLKGRDLTRLSTTCFALYALLSDRMKTDYAYTLLCYVVSAQPVQAKLLIDQLRILTPSNYWLAILKYHHFTEDNGRSWAKDAGISPLQYAAWAGDTFMVKMLLDQIPNEHKHIALEQLIDIQNYGTEHGKCFFALNQLLSYYDEYYHNMWKWHDYSSYVYLRQIRACQDLLPIFMLQVMCDPNQKFHLETLALQRHASKSPPERSGRLINTKSSLTSGVFYTYQITPYFCLSWFSKDFIICHPGFGAYVTRSIVSPHTLHNDFNALISYRDIRQAELVEIISELKKLCEQIEIENTHAKNSHHTQTGIRLLPLTLPMPNYLTDPITGERIIDPIRVSSGHVYDRESLRKFFIAKGRPNTIKCVINGEIIHLNDLSNETDAETRRMLDEFINANENSTNCIDTTNQDAKLITFANAATSNMLGESIPISVDAVREARLRMFDTQHVVPLTHASAAHTPSAADAAILTDQSEPTILESRNRMK